MSKGSHPRPHDPTKFRSEWERIFMGLAEQRAEQIQAKRDAVTHPAREEEDTTREEE